MIVDTKNATRRYNRKKNNGEKSKIAIDINTFDILCKYVLGPVAYVRMNHLSNLNNLISSLDLSIYENNPDKMKRIQFIQKALEARLRYNLTDLNIILNHVMNNINFELDFIDFDHVNLSTSEIEWCHQMVSQSIQYLFVYNYTDKLLDLCTRIQTTDFSHKSQVVEDFEKTIDEIKNKFRQTKTDDNLINMTFSLKKGVFEQCVTDIYNRVTNPSRRLICGMQGLNQMVGGGFESGRVYMFLGITGVGKSVTLLNLIFQLKKWNANYKLKDPTKIPCIVLLTMENTVVETVTRLFDMTVGITSGPGMENYTLQEVLEKLRTEGGLVLNDDSPIDIVMKYKKDKSVDTSYLYDMASELEDQGYEMICLVQDHVKRIRSVFNNPDIRVELGDVVNEMKGFAAQMDIPVLTNSHLNRDATRIVEEGQQKNYPTDVTMKLGKSNTGESLLMIDNLDCGIILNLDFDSDNNKYMVFNLIKMRDKTQRKYIAQPFVDPIGIRMIEDINGEPAFKESLHMNPEVPRLVSVRTSSSNVLSNINNIVGANPPQDNTFSTDPRYIPIPEEENDEDEIPMVEYKKELRCPIVFFNQPPFRSPLIFYENQKEEQITQSGLDDLRYQLEQRFG